MIPKTITLLLLHCSGSPIWGPYSTYLSVDASYLDMSDGALIAQNIVGVATVSLLLASLFLMDSKSIRGQLLLFAGEIYSMVYALVDER